VLVRTARDPVDVGLVEAGECGGNLSFDDPATDTERTIA